MHELSKLVSIPYATFYRDINKMPDLISKEKKGNNILVKLKSSNKSLLPYLSVSSEAEKKEYLEKYPIIKKIDNEINTEDIVVLFGSYAKEKQTSKSDIDILIINKKGDKTIYFSKHELLYKKKINPIFIMNSEFKEMLKDKDENIGKQALKNHIILNNSYKFWECVLDAIR